MNRVLLICFALTPFVKFSAQPPDYLPTEGLVAWYPFNGNSEDESGNNYHGVNNGATLTEDRFMNQSSAFSFSGDCNDRIDMMIPEMIDNTEFTVTFWAKRNGAGCMNPRLWEFHGGERTTQCGWFNQWSHLTFSGFALTEISLENDEWYHFALTNDGIYWKAYLNGSLNNSEIEASVTNSPDLAIGRMNHSGWDSFNGDIDDFGIWNRALSEEEIAAVYLADTIDQGYSSYDGAGVFDGDDHIWLTDSDFFNFDQTSFTAHVRFRPTDLSTLNECCGYQTLLAKGAAGGTGEKGFNIDLRGEPLNARIKCNLSTGIGANVILNAPIVENEWYDLVFVVDWSLETATLFVNGEEVDEGSLVGLGNMNNGWFPTIGRYVWDNSDSNDGHFFNGEIDQIRVLEGADYDLGYSPCSSRETAVLDINDFTAVEVASQVISVFDIDEVITAITPCSENVALGCTDVAACNYDTEALTDDGSCIYSPSITISGVAIGDTIFTDLNQSITLSSNSVFPSDSILLDEFSVSFHSYSSHSLPVSEISKQYRLIATGRFGVADGWSHLDAAFNYQWDVDTGTKVSCDGTQDAQEIVRWHYDGNADFQRPDYDVDNNDLFCSGADKTYHWTIVGDDNSHTVGFSDCCYGDNSGSLDFSFYELIPANLLTWPDGSADSTWTYPATMPGTFNLSASQNGCTTNFVVVVGEPGCMDSTACNYSQTATYDDGSCVAAGCTDATACNYDAGAGCDDGSCATENAIHGCTDNAACNFMINAICDDGGCIYPPLGIDDCGSGAAFCGNGTTWDLETQTCVSIVACGSGTFWDADLETCVCETNCPGELDGDGVIGASDLLQFLSMFGLECAD